MWAHSPSGLPAVCARYPRVLELRLEVGLYAHRFPLFPYMDVKHVRFFSHWARLRQLPQRGLNLWVGVRPLPQRGLYLWARPCPLPQRGLYHWARSRPLPQRNCTSWRGSTVTPAGPVPLGPATKNVVQRVRALLCDPSGEDCVVLVEYDLSAVQFLCRGLLQSRQGPCLSLSRWTPSSPLRARYLSLDVAGTAAVTVHVVSTCRCVWVRSRRLKLPPRIG